MALFRKPESEAAAAPRVDGAQLMRQLQTDRAEAWRTYRAGVLADRDKARREAARRKASGESTLPTLSLALAGDLPEDPPAWFGHLDGPAPGPEPRVGERFTDLAGRTMEVTEDESGRGLRRVEPEREQFGTVETTWIDYGGNPRTATVLDGKLGDAPDSETHLSGLEWAAMNYATLHRVPIEDAREIVRAQAEAESNG